MRLLAGLLLLLAQRPPEAGRVVRERISEGRLRVGDAAPDFELKRLRSEQKMRLSAFRGRKPVALVFGSYT